MPEEIYVFRAGSLGDTVVSLPAWHSIACRHPDRPLHLITPAQRIPGIPDTEDVYRLTGRLGEVIRYDKSRAGLARTTAAVRRIGMGTVYCLMPTRSTVDHLRDFIFMRYVLGLKTQGIGAAIEMNLRLGRFRMPGVATPEWRRLLACAGSDSVALSFPLLEPSSGACNAVVRALEPLGDAPFLVACPGSKMPAKRWPADRYQTVFSEFLAAHGNAGVVLVGSPDERALCQSLAATHPDRILNLAGQLSLDESAALFQRAVCYFGNDTGAMHVAAAMGRPCVAVFSARDVRGKWDPFGAGHTILRENPSCQHCMLIECTAEKMRCLTMIDSRPATNALNHCWQTAISAMRSANPCLQNNAAKE